MRLFKTIKRLLWRRVFWATLFFIMLALNTFVLFAFTSANRNELVFNPLVKSVLPIYRGVRELVTGVIDVGYVFKMKRDVGIPQYRLEVKTSDLQKLNNALPSSLLNEVIDGTYVFNDDLKDTVSGTFYYGDKEYKVKVRYRGLNANHWSRAKKSWQIKFDKDTPFNGIRTLKLIIPIDRGYFAEALNNYRAQKFGLTFPRAEFTQLYVNNEYQGVYFAIEDFSDVYLENNNKPADANIYVTNEPFDFGGEHSTVYDDISLWDKETSDALYSYENFGELDFLLTQLSHNDFTNTVSDLIDMDSFYSWNIVALLAGSNHQSNWGNMRLYFNNTKGKFEFIPWDVGLKNNMPNELTNKLTQKILSDPTFYMERNKRLWEYVNQKENLLDDVAYYDELYTSLKPAFYSDFKKYESNRSFNNRVSEVRNQYQQVIDMLQKVFDEDAVAVQVKHDASKKLVTFDVGFTSFSGLKLSDVTLPFKNVQSGTVYADSNGNGVLDSSDMVMAQSIQQEQGIHFSEQSYFLFDPHARNDDGTFTTTHHTLFVSYDGASIDDISQIDIAFKNAITEKKVKIQSITYADISTFSQFFDIGKSVDAFVQEYPYFRKQNNALVLGPGIFSFASDIVIPRDTTVYIQPGTQMILGPGVSFISYSPVMAEGTASLPIVIRAQKSNEPWGSFGILNTHHQKNILQYVTAEGGSSDYINGVFLSGMVSIYHSDVDIQHSVFAGSQSDDGLNVKYATVEISETTFNANSADGLDLDYTKGNIQNSLFINNGNDGIDVSGSQVHIAYNRIEKSGDKCISVGERTVETVIFNNVLDSCHIGVQVKDGSDIVVLNTIIKNNDIGLDAYRKKELYIAGGSMHVFNSTIRENKESIVFDSYSLISASYNNIENGYTGEHNYDTVQTSLQDVGKGNTVVLKEYLDIDTHEAPVGLWKEL